MQKKTKDEEEEERGYSSCPVCVPGCVWMDKRWVVICEKIKNVICEE